MILDAKTPVAYPNRETWGKFYAKFQLPLVNSLSSRYSYADREDAVEEAFHKLMHKKDMMAYGEKLPQTEVGWYWNLHWQARSFLSHIKSRSDIHAKELEDTFIPELQGIGLDSNIRSEALVKALEIFKAEQDISRRDLNVFILRERLRMPSKKVAARYNLTVDNVDVIKHRIGKLLRKYGRDCYLRALRRAA